MAEEIENDVVGQSQDAVVERFLDRAAAINERLLLSSVHQQELREAAEKVNAQLQGEMEVRKKAEDALRESEERFRAFVLASSDAVYCMSPDWSEMRRLNGRNFVAETATPNRSWLQKYIPPEDQPQVLAVINEAIRSRSIFNLEHRMRRLDGTWGWTSSRAVPVFDAGGEIVEWFGAARDVTERREAEELRRASAERFRFMAESMPQKVFTAKPDGEVDYFNGQWTEFTGLSFEQLRDWEWRQFIHPDDLETTTRHWHHSIATGERFELEHRLRHRDGTYRWHLSRAHPMRDSEGKVLMWIGSNTDVDEGRCTREELARASRAKDDFLAALSHELRTPLTPVLMTAAALERDRALSREIREQFGMVRRNIELEARLIDDLLDLTRVAHGKLQIHQATTDLHELLEQTAEIASNDGFGKKVSIVFALGAARHHIMGDSARLQQVFWNIIKNALKFSAAGETVTVTSRNDEAERIIVSVSDNGIGIRPEALPHIFKAFDQGGITFQQRFGGLGLGLAISRAIVEIHHGEIQAESEGVGRGTTLSVTLATVDAPRGAPAAQGQPPPRPQGRRLLVVEDHEATLTVLERLLRRSGHHVISASTMRDGIAAAAREPFDAVISDLGLPDGTGFELMEELRAAHGLRGIALSGYGMDDDLRRSRAAGFGAHLTKPIEFAQLERTLEEVLAGTDPPPAS